LSIVISFWAEHRALLSLRLSSGGAALNVAGGGKLVVGHVDARGVAGSTMF
jgi:hypothetical protein